MIVAADSTIPNSQRSTTLTASTINAATTIPRGTSAFTFTTPKARHRTEAEAAMPRRGGWRVCTVPGCGEFVQGGGRCEEHQRQAEQKRGTARQRGYGRGHETRFRPAVLARDPICVLCKMRPSVHADHHPHSRRELVEQGLDPNDPCYGRGLCGPCHSSETAKAQPGGWNQ